MSIRAMRTTRPSWLTVYAFGVAGCLGSFSEECSAQAEPQRANYYYTSNNTVPSTRQSGRVLSSIFNRSRTTAGETTFLSPPQSEPQANYYAPQQPKSLANYYTAQQPVANFYSTSTPRQATARSYSLSTSHQPAALQQSITTTQRPGYAAQYQINETYQYQQQPRRFSWPWSRKNHVQMHEASYAPTDSAQNGPPGAVQTGNASWYGKDFHGGKTANGERYDMYSLTAAHRTLPFGTKVKVTNLDNGQEVVVRINNRGPYLKDRIIDLSKGAAREIGMLGDGIAKIRLQVLGRD